VTSATFTPAGAAAASWTAPATAQVTSLQYDAADRLTRITYPNSRYVAYTYDSGGRLSGISTPEGALLSYGYNAAGRLAAVGNPANPGQPFAAYSYNAAGLVSRVDHPNGAYTEYGYDAAGRVTSVVNRAGSGVHSSFTYAYDAAGRIQSMTTLQGTATFSYDADGRLTGATLPGHSVQYTYDAAGNRVSTAEDGVNTPYTTNSLDQYTAAGSAAFGYDAAGNLATAGGGAASTFSYDDEGRLTRAVTPAGTWAYEYDVLGSRSAVIKDGQRTEYLVDPQGLGDVIGEYGPGGLVARYVHGLGLIGRVSPGNAAAFYELDALGSVVGLSGAGGNLLNQYSYLPFGKTAAASETVANPFKFAGGPGVMDDGSGLLYMRRRYYSPALGRFTGPDPLRRPGANAYTYALNSPVAFTDPTGLAVTADRLGGFEDSLAYGDGAGKAAPGVAQAYEALVVAQQRPPAVLWLRGEDGRAQAFPLGTAFESCRPYGNPRAGECFKHRTRDGVEWIRPVAEKPRPELSPFAPRRVDKFTTVYYGEGTITFIYQLPGNPPEWSRYTYYNGQQGQLIASSDPPTTKQSSSSAQQVASHDPNDMVGPAGFGPQNYVAGDQALMYSIRFENDKAASAPAQIVRLTQTLAPALDRGAFELVAVGFGGRTWAIPDGRASYSTRFDVRSTLGLFVDFQAEFNTVSGELVATLTSIDPATGALPTNLMSGFLPPNVTPPQGDGFLTYRVRSLTAAASGTQVQAAGRVYFDDNPPIDTPVISNALDMGYPAGKVSPLPATVFRRFTVAWNGSDEAGGSGVGTWDLYVSKNGGPFTLAEAGTPATSTTVQGEVGATYAFYVLAIDNTGHRQKAPGPEQATVVVEGGGSVMLPLLLRAK